MLARGPRAATLILALALALTACDDTTAPTTDPGAAVALVEARREATCVLTEDGRVFCWGVPIGGFLCNDDCIETPAVVPAAHPFDTLALGGSNWGEVACGLGTDGIPHCWGALLVNLDGAADLGSVPEPLTNAIPLRAVSIGIGHICGLARDLKTYCWGDYDGARRGQEVPSPGGIGYDFVPNIVRGAHEFVALQAGAWNTCGIDQDKQGWCWGAGHSLGNTTVSLLIDPDVCGYGRTCSFDPLPIDGGYRIVVFAGREGCGVGAGGALICWDGAFGDPPRAPEAVALPMPVVRAVSGREHQCVLDNEGAAWCWGSNEHGQLGIGQVTSAAAPTPVNGQLRFQSLTAGYAHTCGVTTDAQLYCWGANGSGRLGTGGRVDAREPARITIPSKSPSSP